ncbi:Hypothetical_protein [Hexamita inflata]|uniref:Hypothetical_protein n=1 Tax=Hexamita inflata TaxID=28002 RepID=A0AA86PA29_9EUKA|nr:Hypothetical protein HINF_LOCUS22497 [Hexamita inflata]
MGTRLSTKYQITESVIKTTGSINRYPTCFVSLIKVIFSIPSCQMPTKFTIPLMLLSVENFLNYTLSVICSSNKYILWFQTYVAALFSFMEILISVLKKVAFLVSSQQSNVSANKLVIVLIYLKM